MYPTPYAEVNRFLDELLSAIRTALGDRLVGLYLYGSLALGDFDPRSSDIDFVAVTDGALSGAAVQDLRALHGRLTLHHPRWAKELEGSYTRRRD